MDIIVGQKLFLKSKSSMVVTKVGWKTFETKDLVGVVRKFDIETMLEHTSSKIVTKAFLSINDVEDEHECDVLYKLLTTRIGKYLKRENFTVNKLRKLVQVLNEDI